MLHTYIHTDRHTYRASDEAGSREAFAPKNRLRRTKQFWKLLVIKVTHFTEINFFVVFAPLKKYFFVLQNFLLKTPFKFLLSYIPPPPLKKTKDLRGALVG